MGPYAGVDYNLSLRPLQHIYHGQTYARVDYILQSGTFDLASGTEETSTAVWKVGHYRDGITAVRKHQQQARQQLKIQMEQHGCQNRWKYVQISVEEGMLSKAGTPQQELQGA
jgi:hypothetical protein